MMATEAEKRARLEAIWESVGGAENRKGTSAEEDYEEQMAREEPLPRYAVTSVSLDGQGIHYVMLYKTIEDAIDCARANLTDDIFADRVLELIDLETEERREFEVTLTLLKGLEADADATG